MPLRRHRSGAPAPPTAHLPPGPQRFCGALDRWVSLQELLLAEHGRAVSSALPTQHHSCKHSSQPTAPPPPTPAVAVPSRAQAASAPAEPPLWLMRVGAMQAIAGVRMALDGMSQWSDDAWR